jgi:hypothetical protein
VWISYQIIQIILNVNVAVGITSSFLGARTEYGFKGVIAKPYRPQELREILSEVLGE